MKAIAIAAAAAVLMGLTPVHADRDPQATLTVRLYNSSAVPAERLLAARHVAAAILEETGVAVAFRHCGSPISGQPVDVCGETLAPSEVVVRIINAPAHNLSLHPGAYGVTYVLDRTNRGWLATVFEDRTATAAARVGIEPGTLLGRVVAHEVGHLLLGAGYHGDAGLMRAQWPDARLGRAGDEWRFSSHEAARIYRAVTSVAGFPSGSAPSS